MLNYHLVLLNTLNFKFSPCTNFMFFKFYHLHIETEQIEVQKGNFSSYKCLFGAI